MRLSAAICWKELPFCNRLSPSEPLFSQHLTNLYIFLYFFVGLILKPNNAELILL